MIYKLITKVMANRMKGVLPKLINSAQTSFVPGRNITDNTVIAQEVVHLMRKHNGEKYMSLKIDLQKAHDMLR